MQVLSKEKTGEFSKLWGLRIKTNFKRGLKNFNKIWYSDDQGVKKQFRTIVTKNEKWK